MSTNIELLRSDAGERIDHPDFEFLATSFLAAVNRITEHFIVGTDDVSEQGENFHPKTFVLAGFETTNPSGTTVTVTKDVVSGTVTQPGAAIAAYRELGQPRFGAVLAGGDASKSVDVLSFPNGTYGVYVRLQFRDAEIQNRLFWNPITPTPVEFPRAIATRRSESWDVAIELVSPGPEWLLIAELDRATMDITDRRNFFFEGQAANDYEVVDAEWGSTTDRDDDRAVHGVTGLYRAIRGLQRQVQDIIGGAGWWVTLAGASARSLAQLVSEKLNRDGSQTMEGDLLPDDDATQSLGSALARWLYVHAAQVNFELNLQGTATGSQALFLSGGAAGSSQGELTNDPTGGPGSTSQVTLLAGTGAEGRARLAGSTAHLDADDVQLARDCEGQNGFFYFRSVDFNIDARPPNTSISTSTAISPPAGVDITTDDFIVGWNSTTYGSVFAAAIPVLFNFTISATNTIRCTYTNTDDAVTLTAATYSFDFVILKSAPLTP